MTRRQIRQREAVAIFHRAKGVCHICGQKIEGGREAWEVEHVIPLNMGGTEDKMDENLQPAHVACHRAKTAQDARHMAKAERMQARGLGIKKRTSRPLPGSRGGKWKRKLDGTVVLR